MDVRNEGGSVLLIVDGKCVADLPWQAALQVQAAIRAKACLAREYAEASRVISDQALMLRKGIPIGFTDNPKIQDEAAKEAVNNRELRRALPGGVKSQEHVGTPKVITHGNKRQCLV